MRRVSIVKHSVLIYILFLFCRLAEYSKTYLRAIACADDNFKSTGPRACTCDCRTTLPTPTRVSALDTHANRSLRTGWLQNLPTERPGPLTGDVCWLRERPICHLRIIAVWTDGRTTDAENGEQVLGVLTVVSGRSRSVGRRAFTVAVRLPHARSMPVAAA